MTREQIVKEAGEKGQDIAFDYGRSMIVVSRKTIAAMDANAQKMGEMILQLGTMIGTMQRRLDHLEAQQAQVTISHGDVRRLQAKIRWRADAICSKYGLRDPESVKRFRAAIRKDILQRYQVKDLHDIPEAMLPAVHKQIENWTDIRMIMERRVST